MPDWWLPYVQSFVSRVQWLSQFSSFQVSSFGRTRSHNASVGGASSSQHLVWTAADLVPEYPDTMETLSQAASDSQAFGYVLNEGDHVHVQLFPASQIPPWVFDAVSQA
jgi:hypothetical protein